MDREAIWTATDILKITGGNWIGTAPITGNFHHLTFPLVYLQSSTILIHVTGPGWQKKTIKGSGQLGMSIDELIKLAEKYQNSLIISTERPLKQNIIPVIQVKSSHKALFQLSGFQRNKFKGKVIGITGTAGKSSVKDILAMMLNKIAGTSVSMGNWNTSAGVALTLTNLNPEHKFAVIEISGGAIMGMQGYYALDMAQPHDGIITSIGINLTSRTPTRKDVARVKSTLFKELQPNSHAYFPADIDELEIVEDASSHLIRYVSGEPNRSTVSVKIEETYIDGTLLSIQMPGFKAKVKTALIGPGQIMNFSLAAQTAVNNGLQGSDLLDVAKTLTLAKRKMEYHEYSYQGIKLQFIDDCHNATLLAFNNALGHIKAVKEIVANRIFIIGKIVHIEGQEETVYQNLAQTIIACNPTLVIIFDDGLELLAKQLSLMNISLEFAESLEDVFAVISSKIDCNSFIFLKGSNRKTQIRALSQYLKSKFTTSQEVKPLSLAIASTRWTSYEARYLLASLDYYNQTVFINSQHNNYNSNEFSVLYALDKTAETITLAKQFKKNGCDIFGIKIINGEFSQDKFKKPTHDELVTYQKVWRAIAVDAHIVCVYQQTFNNKESIKRATKEEQQRIKTFLLQQFSGLTENNIYGLDIGEKDQQLYLLNITSRPKLKPARKLYGLDIPSMVYNMVSTRKLSEKKISGEQAVFTMLFFGDTNPGETYQQRNEELGKENILKSRGYLASFQPFLALLKSANYRLLNLETVITSECQSPFKNIKPYLDWTSKEHTPALLKKLEINAVCLANNHTLDYGSPALQEMLSVLDTEGILHFGAGINDKAAAKPLTIKNTNLGNDRQIIIVTGFEYRKNHDDWGYYAKSGYGVNAWSRKQAMLQVSKVRKENPAAILIAFPHWGSNYCYKKKKQEKLAHALIDAGVDLIIGHGSHMMQEIEIYQGKWILYGIGNFIYNAPGRYRNFDVDAFGLIPKLKLFNKSDTVTANLELYPIFIDNRETDYKTRYVDKKQFNKVLKRLFPYGDQSNEQLSHVVFGRNQYGYHLTLKLARL